VALDCSNVSTFDAPDNCLLGVAPLEVDGCEEGERKCLEGHE
jgi:hypothetical protein